MIFSFDIYAIDFSLTEVEGEHEFVVVVTTNIMLSSFAQILPWTTINVKTWKLNQQIKFPVLIKILLLHDPHEVLLIQPEVPLVAPQHQFQGVCTRDPLPYKLMVSS